MWGEGAIEGEQGWQGKVEEEREKKQVIYVRIDRSSILVLMSMLLEWIGNRNGGHLGNLLLYPRFCKNLRRYLLRASSIRSRWIPKLWGWVEGCGWLASFWSAIFGGWNSQNRSFFWFEQVFINQMEFADLVEFMFGKIVCHFFFFKTMFRKAPFWAFQQNKQMNLVLQLLRGIGTSTSRWHHPLWHRAGPRSHFYRWQNGRFELTFC